MASIMNSGDAGSFTSAYEFELYHKIKIDGPSKEPSWKKSRTFGDMNRVMLDGMEFIITVRAERLTQFETESETESESRSRSKKGGKYQETIQSSTTSDPGTTWETN